jgi:hypothetical protein
VTTPSQLHTPRNMPSADRKGESVADSQSGPAHDPSVSVEHGRDHGNTNGGGASASAAEGGWHERALDEDAADRYAQAFRPSWAPLDGSELKSSTVPAPAYLRVKPAANASNERPVRLAVPGKRRSARLLAVLSIAGFVLLAYWGVSSTAKPSGTQSLAGKPRATGGDTAGAIPQPSATGTGAADEPRPQLPRAAETAAVAPGATEPTALLPRAAEPTALARLAQEPAANTPTTPGAASDSQPTAAANRAAAVPPDRAALDSPPTAPTSAANALAPNQKLVPPANVGATANAVPAANAGPVARAVAAGPAQAPAPPLAAIASAPLHARSPLLVVRALPEGARLWLDGQRMANPFDVRVDRNVKHRIEARSEGYETSSQNVRIESDAKLTITLRAAPEVHDPRLKTPSSSPASRPRGAGFVSVSPY